jgi:hypothetical protein
VDESAGQVAELEITRRVRATRAARFAFPAASGDAGEGLQDYAGAFEPGFTLERMAQPVLARQCKEFALDAHLLMRAAFLSIVARWGEDAAHALAREHWAAVAPVHLPRVRAALGIGGEDAASVLKTLQVDPAFPPDYLRRGFALVDERCGRFWLEDCEALAAGEPGAWIALLEEDDAASVLDATVAAVNPRARCHPLDPAAIRDAAGPVRRAFEVRIDPEAEPHRESPMANAVRASNAAAFVFREGSRPRPGE